MEGGQPRHFFVLFWTPGWPTHLLFRSVLGTWLANPATFSFCFGHLVGQPCYFFVLFWTPSWPTLLLFRSVLTASWPTRVLKQNEKMDKQPVFLTFGLFSREFGWKRAIRSRLKPMHKIPPSLGVDRRAASKIWQKFITHF